MTDIPNVGGTQIMGTVGINYMPAIQASAQCVTALEAVNAALKGTQAAAKHAGDVLASQLSQSVSSGRTVLDQYGRAMAMAGEETGRMAQKAKIAESELAKIENRLVSVIASSQKSGVAIPGMDAHLESIRGIRDIVQSGGEVSREQLKAVNGAREFSIIQQNTLRTLEREAEAIRNMQSGEEMLADSASRRLTAEQLARERINRQWDEYLAKQKAADSAAIKKQEEAAWKEYARLQEAGKRASADATKKELAQYDLLLKKQSETLRLLPAMEAQVASVQAKMGATTGVATEQIKTQASLLRAQIVQLRQRLKTEADITKAEMQQVAQLEKQVSLLAKNATIAKADYSVQTQQVKEHSKSVKELANSHTFLQHRMGWFVSGTMFYGTMRAARQAVEAIKEVETGMVIIRRVANDATIDFDKMRTELLQAGIDFGHSWDVVQEAATRWALAGYRGNDIIELTRTSLLGLNVAEMDINMATQGLIAIMAQWGFETHELVTVIDKLNKTSDNYAVTTGDLVEALVRSSGAARALNLTFEETVGLITATRVASGRLGREVGNALNTIFSYITRQGTLNKMTAAGIDVYADAAQTRLKPAMQLLTDFAERWSDSAEDMPEELINMADSMGLLSEEIAVAVGMEEEWTELQKIGLEQSMAGVRRRNFLIALLRNFAMAQDVVNGMLDVEGYSMKQNAETTETLEKRISALKTAFTMLAVEIGEAGILEMSKNSVDVVRGWVEAFEKLPPALKKAIILLGGVATSFGVVNLTAKTFFSIDIAKKLMNIGKATKATTGATLLYTGAAGGATLATTGLTGALGSLVVAFRALPIVGQIAILGALAGVIASLITSTESATEKTKEMMRQNTEAADRARTQADEIEKLAREYENLAKKEEGASKKSDEFKKVTKELTDLVPSAITGFDSMGNAITNIGIASEESRKKVAELRAEVTRNLAANAALAQSMLPQLEKEKKEAQNKRDLIQSRVSIGNYQGVILDKRTGSDSADQFKWTIGLMGDLDKRKRANELFKTAIDEYTEAEKKLLEAQKAITIYESIKAGKDPFGSPASASAGKKGGGVITESATQAYERLNAERAKLNHQMKVGEISTAQYLAALQRIERDMRAAGVEEQKIWSIQEEIHSLGGKGGKAYKETIEEREREAEARAREIKQFYDDAFNDAMGYYRHVNSLARSSRDEQIQYLRELTKAHEWEKAKMWTLEEEMFRLYQDELKDQQSKFDKAYNDRIKAIEDERDAKISAIEAELAAMDREKKNEDRAESEKTHGEKMTELRKQRQYHELRTGAEHKKAIAEIDKQIEEENQRWKKEQDDWARDDKKEALRQQVEDIKEAAEKEKEIWKQKYDEIKANWDNWVAKFAQAAIKDPRWLEIGKAIGGQLASGFSLSVEDMGRRIGNVGTSVSKIDSGGYSGGSPTGYNIMGPEMQHLEQTWPGGALAYIEGQRERYKKARMNKDYDLMKRLEADAARVGYTFDQGGIAFGKGIMFKDTIKPERILSPQLTVSFDRLAAVLEKNPISSSVVNQGGNSFNAPLFYAQNVNFEDKQDMEILGRELQRQIQAIRVGG